MTLSEGYKEDLRNHYEDGYKFGVEDERNRIREIVSDSPTMEINKNDLLLLIDEEE